MNAEKKVFSRLFTEEKTELATQKIELGLMDLVDKQYGKATSQYEKALSNSRRKINDAIGDLSQSEGGFIMLVNSYNDAFSKIKSIDSDLANGWDKKNNGILNFAKASIKQISQQESKLKSLLSILK